MPDPQPVSAGFAALAATLPPGNRLREIAEDAVNAGNECVIRRARVLRHADLAARLTQHPLNYQRPDQWNGWVAPRSIDPESTGESCHITHLDRSGSMSFRWNQMGRRTMGEQRNDSPRRAALVDIAAEALRREQETTP